MWAKNRLISICDFSAGENEDDLDATSLNASTFGVDSSFWSVKDGAGYLKYSSDAKRALGGDVPHQAVNDWPGDIGSLGASLYIPDNITRYARYAFPGVVAQTVTAGVWFKTDYPSDSLPNLDIFTIWSAPRNNYTNVPFIGNGTTLRLRLETPGMSDYTYIPISRNTWYWMAIRYTSDISGRIKNAVRIYDNQLSMVDNEINSNSIYADLATSITFGFAAAPGNVYGYSLHFSGLVMCHQRTAPWPILPNRL